VFTKTAARMKIVKDIKMPMKNTKEKPWLVLCKDGKHFFSTQSQVVKFIAKRKGKIGCIMFDGKLIPSEVKIYHAGLKLAGLAN